MRDVSGSMGPDQTLLCLGIAWWLVGALRRVYEQVALDFWVHHHEARRVAEPAFWTIGPSGGTRAQVAYEAVADAWVTAYPPTGWVWYLVHFSDGEDGDAAGAARVIATRWAPVAALVGLVELRRATEAPAAESRSVLGRALAALPDPPVRVVTVQGPADAGPALQRLFADAPREEGSA